MGSVYRKNLYDIMYATNEDSMINGKDGNIVKDDKRKIHVSRSATVTRRVIDQGP